MGGAEEGACTACAEAGGYETTERKERANCAVVGIAGEFGL